MLLRDAEPSIRADACRCARALPELILILIDLLEDIDRRVATSAALALGRMGKIEARPILKGLLRDAPAEDVIEAASSIVDEECAVLLGRIARSGIGPGQRSTCRLGECRPRQCPHHCGCDPALAACIVRSATFGGDSLFRSGAPERL